MNRSSTSPFKPMTAGRGIPGNTPESLELLIKSLERENNSLVEEINILKTKGRRISELEDKIDLVLKHNTQLLSENEKLVKLINQKKSEVEVWKNKYETLTVNRNASSELQNRKLINEIEKLKQEITEIEHLKNMQISELKNQNHLEIQNIKRTNLGNNEKYELEIRKLKEYCEKKEYEISDLNMKFVRLNKETDFEIGKLKEEKDRLRSDLLYEEEEHKKEVDSLKSKFQYNFHSEIENIKKQHLNQIDALDYENSKLKEVINSKNMEIEQILAKNLKVKSNYEDSIDLLKNENEDLKEKILETEHIADIELNNLREKLEGMKESELSLLRSSHNNQLDLLNREISKLQQIIDSRNSEIETLAKERNQMRLSLEAQALKARTELEAQLNQNKEMAQKHERTLDNYDRDFKAKNEEMKTIESYLQTQVASLKEERDNINNLFENKTQELKRTRDEAEETKQNLENERSSWKEKATSYKDDLERDSRKSSGEITDVKKSFELKSKQYESKIRGLEEEVKERDNLIKQLNDIIATKDKEIRISDEKISKLQSCEKELRREDRDNTARWQAKVTELNSLMSSQIEAMRRTREKEIGELKAIQENKVNSMKHQIKELERQIEDKNRVLNGLKQNYEELVSKFEQVFAQRAAQKNLDIKIPGWIPDTIAIKSLFDVFLKNKVLEYCS